MNAALSKRNTFLVLAIFAKKIENDMTQFWGLVLDTAKKYNVV